MDHERAKVCHFIKVIANVFSSSERELLEELASLSSSTTSRSRTRPRTPPPGKMVALCVLHRPNVVFLSVENVCFVIA